MAANSVAAGPHTCTITADDTYVNGVNTGTFTITIDNRPTVTGLIDVSVYQGRLVNYDISTYLGDVDIGDRLALTY